MSISGCDSTSPPTGESSTQTAVFSNKLAEVILICQVFMDFHDRNDNWPNTYDELAEFSEQIGFTIPSWFQEQYRSHCFKSSEDGSLHMEFNLGYKNTEGNDTVCVLPVTLSKADPNLDESTLDESLKESLRLEMLKLEMRLH